MTLDEEKIRGILKEKGLKVDVYKRQVLLHALEERGIYVSSGSACSSNKPGTAASATLRAIGLDKELMGSTLRFSMSVFTTEEEIRYTLNAVSYTHLGR